MLLGLVEFGHGMNSYLTVVAAARDSARLGAQLGVDANGVTAMQNVVAKEIERLDNSIDTSVNCPGGRAYVCITSCEAPLGPGNCTGSPKKDRWLKVEVCYDHTTITGVDSITNPINMCSSTKIRIAK
jgi:Flp pilus assembly protein TadG